MTTYTCLATFPFRFTSRPAESNSSTVPMGASAAVAVVTVTLSASAHNDDNASPRNPKVDTESRSEKDESLEV